MTTLLISAGDASGDLHGADFVRSFRRLRPDTRFVGLGGDEMERAGVELIVHQRDLAVGGLFELFGSLPRIVSAWRTLVKALARHDPELVVLIDSSGFNLPFARRVRRTCGAKILYFVAPQVWAWRRGRIPKLASRVDRMAVIFPFEPEIYKETSLEVDYVGHPLVETLAALCEKTDRSEARRLLDFDPDAPLVALFPGSRSNEIRKQLPVQLAAAQRIHSRDPRVRFALVVAPSVDRGRIDEILRDAQPPDSLRLELIEGRSREVMLAADVALAKPGTVTVELTLLGRPMVVMGCTSALTAAILRRAVKLPSLSMPNLIAGEPVVPEFLQEEAQPDAIAEAVMDLFEGPVRERQLKALEDVKRKLGTGGAATRAGQIAEEMIASSHP